MLCEHTTLNRMPDGYTTVVEHLPVNSATRGEWNSQRYLKWARHVFGWPGTKTLQTVPRTIKIGRHSFRFALNDACHHALERSTYPGYRLIKQLLNTGTCHLKSSTPESTEQFFLRGADYYEQ